MNEKKKIACVGDSITYGYASSNPDVYSYPAKLGKLLGDGFKVGNFGLSGSTMMPGFFPYYGSEEHKAALAFEPDIVVLMLGTNDSTFFYRFAVENDYVDASEKMLASFLSLKKKPKIFIGLVPHLYSVEQFSYHIENTIIPIQRSVAEKYGLETIDIHSKLDRPELFVDGVHPTEEGYGIIAQTVSDSLAEYLKK